MSAWRELCAEVEIADPGAKGFTVPDEIGARELFAVRRDGATHVYVNSCPHIGTPLAFLPDRFLTRDGRMILCSTHGAIFEIATGLCVAGPCKGRRLGSVSAMVRDGRIFIAL